MSNERKPVDSSRTRHQGGRAIKGEKKLFPGRRVGPIPGLDIHFNLLPASGDRPTRAPVHKGSGSPPDNNGRPSRSAGRILTRRNRRSVR